MSFLEYKFLPRTPELIAHRRVHLDRYANLAQLSQVAIHLLILSYNLVLSTSASKHAGKSPKNNPSALSRIANAINSRLGTEVSRGYGTYGQWLFGLVWTAWLGFLCFAETTPGTGKLAILHLRCYTDSHRVLTSHQAIRAHSSFAVAYTLSSCHAAVILTSAVSFQKPSQLDHVGA